MAAFVVFAATSRTGGPRLSSRGAICGPPVIASCLPRRPAALVDAGVHMSLRRGAVGEPDRFRVAAIAAVAVVGAFVATNFVAPAQIAHAFTIQSEPLRFSQSLLNDKPEQEKMLHVRWDRHSQDSTTETVILFENNIDEVVDLFWVNYEGAEVYYASITPGSMHIQPSYASHPWVLRNHISQSSYVFFVAGPDPQLCVVGKDFTADSAEQPQDSLPSIFGTPKHGL